MKKPIPPMALILSASICVTLCSTSISGTSLAHGFNANKVDIAKTLNGKYVITVWYSHVEIGEYRQATLEFDKKKDALEAFKKLKNGADFFLGDAAKTIHFHNPNTTNRPY
jgi:hypothetical protein